jgi:hypothetical protein
MKRLIALAALALTLAFAAACSPDDSGASGAPGLESPNSLESPAISSPSLESMVPGVSPAS